VALWDNARFILIALVVIGHTMTTARTGSAFGYAIYSYIYLFHMPAMIALSGLFSKPEATPKAVRSTLQLLATWVVWEIIWALINFFASGRPLPGSWLVVPAWTLWFLVTLATMRILLPYIARLRHPLVFSIAVALAAGLSPAIGTGFSASRTLCFLPFFVAAWLAKDRGWLSGEWFMRPARGARAAGWALLALIAAVFVALPNLRSEWRIDRWLTWRDDYARLFDSAPIGDWAPHEWWAVALGGIGVRSALLLIAAAMTLALQLIVPRGHSVITVWGARTLFVYLLHGPIIQLLRGTGAVDWMASLGVPGVVTIVAVGVAIAVLLSMTWVTKVFRPVIEPRLDWLYARDPAAVTLK
jgi:fucose 4-O-acetylase-like acetyltransferase